MKKPAPSLKELWVKGDVLTKFVLAACAAFVLFLFFGLQLYKLFENGWFVLLVLGGWFAYAFGIEREKQRRNAMALGNH